MYSHVSIIVTLKPECLGIKMGIFKAAWFTSGCVKLFHFIKSENTNLNTSVNLKVAAQPLPYFPLRAPHRRQHRLHHCSSWCTAVKCGACLDVRRSVLAVFFTISGFKWQEFYFWAFLSPHVTSLRRRADGPKHMADPNLQPNAAQLPVVSSTVVGG